MAYRVDNMLLVIFNQEQPDLERAKGVIEAGLEGNAPAGIDFALVSGVDFVVQTCGEGDPLLDLSEVGSGTDISPKQANLLKWKLDTLRELNTKAVRIPGVDPAAAQIAVDVYFVAYTEWQEHASRKNVMTKKRAHDLIDAVIEAVNDMEFEISNAN